MSQTVMVLTAHPDDTEMFAGGTIARLAQEGARVLIVIATDGRKGSFHLDSDTLAATRSEEAQRAAAVLGAEPPILLGHPDMEVDHAAMGKLREQFVRLLRTYRPDTTFSEDPFNNRDLHPDHRAVAWASAEAIAYASLPLLHPEHVARGLAPHHVVEKYYYAAGPAASNRIIDITATINYKLAALAEHRSQVISLVESMRRQMQVAGLDWHTVMGDIADDPMAVMTLRLRASCADVGQRGGYQYGEAFRYERFSPAIETLLQQMGR